MKIVKVAAIAWGLAYFLLGAVFSFTLGNHELWTGLTIYLALFLVPLPITFAALWFPRIAAVSLIGCVIISICVSAASVFASGPAPDMPGLIKFVLLHLPHLCFATLYSKFDRVSTDAQNQPSSPFQS